MIDVEMKIVELIRGGLSAAPMVRNPYRKVKEGDWSYRITVPLADDRGSIQIHLTQSEKCVGGEYEPTIKLRSGGSYKRDRESGKCYFVSKGIDDKQRLDRRLDPERYEFDRLCAELGLPKGTREERRSIIVAAATNVAIDARRVQMGLPIRAVETIDMIVSRWEVAEKMRGGPRQGHEEHVKTTKVEEPEKASIERLRDKFNQ